MTTYNAPDLTAAGVEFLANDARRLGLQTKFLTGTVLTGNDPANMQVICDGDTVPLTMYSTIGPLPPGAQASVLSIGDKGLFIIGSQMQAVSVYTLPDNANIGGNIPPVNGGSSPSTGPGSTAPYTSIIVYDTFNRTVPNGWSFLNIPIPPSDFPGNSNNGFHWATSVDNGSDAYVEPGSATLERFEIVTSFTPPKIVQAAITGVNPTSIGGISVRNHSRWLKNIRVTVAATSVDLKGALQLQPGNLPADGTISPNAIPTLEFYGDGTAELRLSPSTTRIPIPGVTAHQPLDIYAEWHPAEIRIWCELTSVGIDPSSPPFYTWPVDLSGQASISSAELLVRWLGYTNEDSKVQIGEITYELINWPIS